VFDYCERSLLQLSSGDAIPQFPSKEINSAGKYIIFMSLLENYTKKPVDLVGKLCNLILIKFFVNLLILFYKYSRF
jgi:hypothetical protein